MTRTINARLVDRARLTSDVCSFTFEAIGTPFAELGAGAHINVHLEDELVRSYSVTDWDGHGRRVSVAVKEEPEGRGGSVAMHRLVVGQEIPISGPRNNFALATADQPTRLTVRGCA